MPALSRPVPTHRARASASVVSIEDAREMIGKRIGKPMARQTILAEGLRGNLEIHQSPRGFVVPLASIDAYVTRRSAVP